MNNNYVLYKPGEEPERIKQRIERLLEKLEGAYPDKVVVGLHKNHKKWGETVAELYRELNYPSGNDFLEAYGFTVDTSNKGGRPKADPMDIINELKRRYANAPVCKSVKELSEQNPDLAPKFKNMQNQSEKFFGMKFVPFLIQEGILAGENKGRTIEDPAVVIAALKNKYAPVPFSGSLDNLKKENLDINWAQLQKYSTNLGTTLKKYLISEGIMEDDSVASLLENVIKELKQRYSEGVKLPQNITELKEQNKDLELKSLSSWIYQIYGKAATDFLIENGILAAEKSEAEQLEELIQELKVRYNDQSKKEMYLTDLKTKNPDLPISNLNKWLRKLNIAGSASQYLISQNILRDLAAEREEAHRKWLEELRLKYTPIAKEKAQNTAFKKIHYAGSSSFASEEELKNILEAYIFEWYMQSNEHHGDMSTVRQLSRQIGKIETPEEIDELIGKLDKKEFTDYLEKLVYGTSYREYVLLYAKYATAESIARTIKEIKQREKGRAKERYWAENLKNAIALSDTMEAAEYIEKDRDLSFLNYVKMRGYESETDYRDTVMLSDFGFDADGIKRYDIGGNVIVVSLNENLAPVLYDTKAKKALKSFPKKSDDTEKAAACAEDYAQLKKDIKEFYKKRREYMLRLYINNEKISFDVWNKIYCNHPLLKHLTEMVIWQDEESVEFMVKDGKCFDVKGEEYVLDTKISPAHVLDMTEQDIRDWQNYLATTKTKLLIDQVWEPVVGMDENIRSRYDGYVITAKDRNALKKELKDKGIDVRAERYGGDFNHRAWQYEFDPEADMILGNCAKLHYVVDEQSGDLTLGTLTTYGNRGGKRELNAVIHALDKASVKAGIAADRAELLTKDFLERFTAAQIIDFISFAAEKKSSNCAAVLLEFKNESFEAFDATDEFTLDF